MFVTQYSSWLTAAPVRPFFVGGGRSQTAQQWPVHKTPRRGSHRAHNPPPEFGTMLYSPQTRDWRPGGGGGGEGGGGGREYDKRDK